MAHALRLALRPRADTVRLFQTSPDFTREFRGLKSSCSWKGTNPPPGTVVRKPLVCKGCRLSSPCLACRGAEILSLERRGFLCQLFIFRGIQPVGPPGECQSAFKDFPLSKFGGFWKAVKGVSSTTMEYLDRGGAGGNEGLVAFLQKNGMLKSERVASAMRDVDRGLFVPSGAHPYADTPQPIGHNATISAPHMHACCLDLLERHLQPGMKCLDIGSGTGYLTAVMGLLVGESGRAIGIEHIPELVAKSKQDIARSKAAHLQEKGVISLHCGDGRLGWPTESSFDAIHVGAAAGTIPQALLEQLKPGGRMVIPVGEFFQDLRVVDKHMDGTLHESTATEVRYVPLTSRAAQLQGF